MTNLIVLKINFSYINEDFCLLSVLTEIDIFMLFGNIIYIYLCFLLNSFYVLSYLLFSNCLFYICRYVGATPIVEEY